MLRGRDQAEEQRFIRRDDPATGLVVADPSGGETHENSKQAFEGAEGLARRFLPHGVGQLPPCQLPLPGIAGQEAAEPAAKCVEHQPLGRVEVLGFHGRRRGAGKRGW